MAESTVFGNKGLTSRLKCQFKILRLVNRNFKPVFVLLNPKLNLTYRNFTATGTSSGTLFGNYRQMYLYGMECNFNMGLSLEMVNSHCLGATKPVLF